MNEQGTTPRKAAAGFETWTVCTKKGPCETCPTPCPRYLEGRDRDLARAAELSAEITGLSGDNSSNRRNCFPDNSSFIR
jgi:hypothetical protein